MSEIVVSIISITLLILLLIAIVIIVFFVAARQRVKQEKILAETRLAFEREIRKVETEVSEHIMGQFAQELHDNIGQLLTAVHIQIENQKIDYPQISESYKPIEIYLGEITLQLRLLSRTLNTDHIGNIGLLASLQTEVDRLNSLRRFNVHWQGAYGPSNLEKDQELMVFRIFQEIAQNALRHSGAKNMYVTVNNDNGTFEFRIQDDGRGFDKEKIFHGNKGSGLRNILKRATMAGLSCDISSTPGEGSLFVLKKEKTRVEKGA